MRPPVTSDPLTILLGHNHWATRLDVPGISDRMPNLDVNDWQYETECKP